MSSRVVLLALWIAACGSSELQMTGAPPATSYVEGDVVLGHMRLKKDVCKDVDLRPVGRPIDVEDFVAFLRLQNAETKVVRARNDLVFVELANAGTTTPVRFRVAVLGTPGAAGHELHTALLQHGHGTWGLHRGNLAVLGPEGSEEDIVALAGRFHLACWGVLMIAGHDDTYVVPGGYTEL